MEARGDGDPDPWALHDLQAQMAEIQTGLSSSEVTRQVAGRRGDHVAQCDLRILGSALAWGSGHGGTRGTWLLCRPVCLGMGKGEGKQVKAARGAPFPSL